MKSMMSRRRYRTLRPILTYGQPVPLARSRSIVRCEQPRISEYTRCGTRVSRFVIISADGRHSSARDGICIGDSGQGIDEQITGLSVRALRIGVYPASCPTVVVLAAPYERPVDSAIGV